MKLSISITFTFCTRISFAIKAGLATETTVVSKKARRGALDSGPREPQGHFRSAALDNFGRRPPNGSMIKPIARPGSAAGRRTMQPIASIPGLPDINHPAVDEPVAEDTDARVIQRIPFAVSIELLEHAQFFIEPDVSIPHGSSRKIFRDGRNWPTPHSLVQKKT